MDDLVNSMEESVMHKIKQLWASTNYCQCNECRLDIATYALNRLPPRYVRTLEGKLIHQFDASTIQADAEITAVVLNAMKIVGDNPSHAKEGKKE